MIFAKLDVCFWRDKKFMRAGIAGSGYWAGCLAWLREDSTDDAIIPFDMVGEPLGAGDREGLKLAELLVKVGLFAKRETGYELLGYASKNETKSDIEARRKADRERKSVGRVRTFPSGIRSDSDVFPSGIQMESDRIPFKGIPGSDSGSGSSSGSPGMQGGPPAADTTIQLGDPMPPECSGTAATIGLATMRTVRDVPAEWLKFVGHYAGKAFRHEVPRLWQKWLTKATQDQATEDRRDRERANRPAPTTAYEAASKARADVGYSPPPKGPSNRDLAKQRAEAVPMPPVNLDDIFGPGPKPPRPERADDDAKGAA